jgi:2-succinyl-6-hydroxy-2,4-cyclohexadiene-1-carboxylate synthase
VATLHAEVVGAGSPIVLAHGFTQTGRLWGPFGDALAQGRQLVKVDLPGHGDSSSVEADLESAGGLLLDAAAPAGAEPADLLGYSLGARVALHAALADPGRVRRLILIGGTGGIEDAAAREQRRARDDAMAAELEQGGDLDGFLGRWLANPMFATLPADAAELAERRRNTPAGLASSLRLAGTGTQEPLWERLAGVDLPVLALAGANDPRFVAAGLRIAALTGGVFSAVVGAAHAAHLEQPALCARIVESWLSATEPAAG